MPAMTIGTHKYWFTENNTPGFYTVTSPSRVGHPLEVAKFFFLSQRKMEKLEFELKNVSSIHTFASKLHEVSFCHYKKSLMGNWSTASNKRCYYFKTDCFLCWVTPQELLMPLLRTRQQQLFRDWKIRVSPWGPSWSLQKSSFCIQHIFVHNSVKPHENGNALRHSFSLSFTHSYTHSNSLSLSS